MAKEIEIQKNLEIKLQNEKQWVNSSKENQKLLEKSTDKIIEFVQKLYGISKQKSRETGEIIIEKTGEFYLEKFLQNELKKLEEKLKFLEK